MTKSKNKWFKVSERKETDRQGDRGINQQTKQTFLFLFLSFGNSNWSIIFTVQLFLPLYPYELETGTSSHIEPTVILASLRSILSTSICAQFIEISGKMLSLNAYLSILLVSSIDKMYNKYILFLFWNLHSHTHIELTKNTSQIHYGYVIIYTRPAEHIHISILYQ